MEEVRLGGGSVTLLPVVRGLPSGATAVRETIASVRPDTVALSVSPEDLERLRTWKEGTMEPGTVEEEAYVAGLSVWEEPVLPPPCFTEAVRVGTAQGTRLEAIDFDEHAYAGVYTTYVSGVDLIFQGRLEARLLKKKFRVKTPEAFVLAWDAEVNRGAGFTRVQREREKFMASRLRDLAGDSSRVLAVIEVERAKGVLAALRG